MSSFYVKIVIALWVTLTAGAPRTKLLYAGNSVNYLMQFGYLPESERELQSLRTDDQLVKAIKELQRFGGIPVTGEVDEETIRLMKTPRCALADKQDPRFSFDQRSNGQRNHRQKRYLVHGQKWDHLNLTWSLRTKEPSGLDTWSVRSTLKRSLELWAANSKLTFQELNSDTADILVYFKSGYHDDGYPFDGRGQILAHAFFPGPDRGGDAHFDEEEVWLLNDDQSNEGTSLFAVAAHEFGHSLGLAHSSERGALMFPWYQPQSRNYELPEDDRHGIQQMYGAPERKLWGTFDSVPERPERRYPPPTTTTTTSRPTTTTYRPWKTRPRSQYPTTEEPRRRIHPTYYTPKTPNWRQRKPPYDPERKKPDYTKPKTRFTTPITPRQEIPNTCDTTYDAITIIRSEVFVFKGRYFWRLEDGGVMDPSYPAEIIRLFNLPPDIDHVDAVYERPDKMIVFFIGKKYYVFDANKLKPGYPKPLTYLGLPANLEKIDGAMIWGHNNKTYFFSGTMYWRYDEEVRHVEWDYPRDMSMFAGVGYNIDTVFQWKNGKTYFFKGKGFWEFNDLRMKVSNEKQRPSASFWMGCDNVPDSEGDEDSNLPKRARIFSSAKKQLSIFNFYGLSLLVFILLRLS